MNSLFNRMRVVFWLAKATLRRHWRKIVIQLMVLAAMIPISIVSWNWYRTMSRTTTVGIVGRMIPSELPLEITSLLSVGLTTFSKDGQPQPDLAESWEATDSGKVFVFRLKKGLYWHDGKPLFADNIPITLSDASVSYPDSYTLRFELKEPFAPLLAALAKPVLRGSGLVGVGDYRVSAIELDENGRLKKLHLERIRGEYEKIRYTFYENEKSAGTAMRMGEIDILGSYVDLGLGPEHATRVATPISYKKVVAILFNTNDPLFKDDKAVRQGLGFLLTTEEWGEEATGPLPPFSWAYSGEVKRFKDNRAQGRRLIEKKVEKLQHGGITIIAPPYLEPIAQHIAKQWREAGITVRVSTERSLPQEFQIFVSMLDIPADADQYVLWHSSQATNVTHYDSKRVDKALEDGRRKIEYEERIKNYHEFQRYLVEDAPALFLYYPKYHLYFNQKIKQDDALRLKKGYLR